jgi:phosphate:Na+ symporter
MTLTGSADQLPRLLAIRALALAGGVGLFLWMLIARAAEADTSAPPIDWLQVGLGLFGGLALFLGGLQLLSEGMTKAAGETMKVILGRLTTNRFMGAATGAFVTGILNSSTVTTLLVVSFISGGMMTLSQSVGVIMGANIGSTVTAQLLAFNLSAYSLAPVAIGFFMTYSAKVEKVKYYGMMLLGIGLVFYGMGLMSSAMTPLRTFQPFLDLLTAMENPIAGILAGAVFTAVVQSSAATVGIAIAMASEGLLALPAGIALALGANIGTAVTTAIMGVLSSKSVDATRAAVVHVVFNVIGVLIWLPLLNLLSGLAGWLSPVHPELEGMARAAAEVPRQIANANTAFNIINTVLFIGFAPWFARLAERLVPDRGPKEGVIIEPAFLDAGALQAPAIALQQVRLEAGRLGDIVIGMIKDVAPALRDLDRTSLERIAREHDKVDILAAEILKYLGRVRRALLSERESREFQQLMTATDNLESVADVIASDVIGLAQKVADVRESERTGEETRAMLTDLYETVVQAVELTVEAVRKDDQNPAESVLLLKGRIRTQADQLLARKAERLGSDDPHYVTLVRLQMAFVDQMRRIYTLSKRMAKAIVPEVVARED